MRSADSHPKLTIRDLARALGLSRAAVSLGLRDSPEIAAATRERIRAMAREMGYEPNPTAAALSRLRRASTVEPIHAALAWLNLWPDPKKLRTFAEFDRYWQGAKASAEKFGYRLEEFPGNERVSIPPLEKILLARGIPGILLPPHGGMPIDWG